MSLVSEKQSNERWPAVWGNCWVFLQSSKFHNSMTSSDFLSTARNRLSGGNQVTPASITFNSLLDFGVPFSTSHNLTRIWVESIQVGDLLSSIQLIEAMLPCQQPWWMKTKPEPSISNCSSSLLISQMTALSLSLTRI